VLDLVDQLVLGAPTVLERRVVGVAGVVRRVHARRIAGWRRQVDGRFAGRRGTPRSTWSAVRA
jgi:hypothetical protein